MLQCGRVAANYRRLFAAFRFEVLAALRRRRRRGAVLAVFAALRRRFVALRLVVLRLVAFRFAVFLLLAAIRLLHGVRG